MSLEGWLGGSEGREGGIGSSQHPGQITVESWRCMVGARVPREKVQCVLLTGLCRVLSRKETWSPVHVLGKITHRLKLEIGRLVRWPFHNVPNVQEGEGGKEERGLSPAGGRWEKDVRGCRLWDLVRTEGWEWGVSDASGLTFKMNRSAVTKKQKGFPGLGFKMDLNCGW